VYRSLRAARRDQEWFNRIATPDIVKHHQHGLVDEQAGIGLSGVDAEIVV
jgi:hypothetical protein